MTGMDQGGRSDEQKLKSKTQIHTMTPTRRQIKIRRYKLLIHFEEVSQTPAAPRLQISVTAFRHVQYKRPICSRTPAAVKQRNIRIH